MTAQSGYQPPNIPAPASTIVVPEWPEALSQPSVSYDMEEDGAVSTFVGVGDLTTRFWTEDNAVFSTEAIEDEWHSMEHRVKEKALRWGVSVHQRIEEMLAGVPSAQAVQPRVRNYVVFWATGAAEAE